MNHWRQAWQLTRQETRKLLLPVGITLLMNLFSAAMLGYYIQGGPEGPDGVGSGGAAFVANALILAFIPNLSFVLTKHYLRYHKNDIFSRRLAFYLRLPIRREEIVLSRLMIMMMSMLLFSGPFYVVLYWTSAGLGQHIDPWTFLGVSLVWSGISLWTASFCVYLELGYRGSQYLMGSFGMAGVYFLVSGALAFTPYQIVNTSIRAVEELGGFASGAAWIIGLLGVIVMKRITVKRLHHRDIN